MGAGVVVSVSVEPSVIAPGEAARVTVVADDVIAGSGDVMIPLVYQQYPRVQGEDLIATAVATVALAEGRMSASTDLRSARDVSGGRIVVIANSGAASVSTTLTIEESPGSGASRSVITGRTYE